MNQESEFGKGITYCLGLFLSHAERYSNELEQKEQLPHLNVTWAWFNGASDHLYELQTDNKKLSKELNKRLEKFKEDMLNKGHGQDCMFIKNDKKTVTEAIREAQTLLLIDQELEFNPTEATWK